MLESIKPKNKRKSTLSEFNWNSIITGKEVSNDPMITVNKTIELVEFVFKNMNVPVELSDLSGHGCFCNLTEDTSAKEVEPLDDVDYACHSAFKIKKNFKKIQNW